MKLITNTGEVLNARQVDGAYLNVDLGGRGEAKALRGDFIVEMPGGETSIVTLSTVERLGWEIDHELVDSDEVNETDDDLQGVGSGDLDTDRVNPVNRDLSDEEKAKGAIGFNAEGAAVDEFGQVIK